VTDAFYESLAVWSQIVASVLFIVALVVLWVKFIAPAVLAAQARKNADLLESERRRDEARARAEKAQAGIAAADADVLAIKERAEGDARRIHDKIILDGIAEGTHLMQNAEGELERSRVAARDQLRTDLLEKAMAIARESASRLDAKTNERLVGEAVQTAERAAGNL
jgi:F0F1-type ATP synthase membrane subunit b/b'